MAQIACLGWGSLVWDPRELPVHRKWFSDGPFVKVELLRQSSDGRMTFVLSPNVQAVRSCWAVMDAENLESGVQALQKREGNIRSEHVGSWVEEAHEPSEVLALEKWAKSRGLNGVVWTALPCKFAGQEGRSPSVEEVVRYLSELTGATRDIAERYVRLAPRQIDTRYRRRIEASLGWLPIDS
jgi:hypothetical protein